MDTTAELVTLLSSRRPALQRAVSDALGIQGPPERGTSPVAAFVLEETETSSVCYLLTKLRFARVEVTADERTLLVCTPLNRIRQVVEARDSETVTVSIELDADVTAETTVSQSLTGPAENTGTPGTQLTRSEARSVTTPTSYTLRQPKNEPAAAKLTDFARTVRAHM